ncbi:HU family DNA-binding protein [Pararobbsia silviterrae]|nr:HU family DNA-binding protein [Pararobbsia silviterrae]
MEVRKKEFVAAVAAASSLTAAQVSRALKALEEVSANHIKDFGSVQVPGLVTIKRMPVEERVRQKPSTRESFVAPASVLVKAKPVPRFSKRIKAENVPA